MKEKNYSDPLVLRIDLKGKNREKFIYIYEYHGMEAYAELVRFLINKEMRRLKRLEKLEEERLKDVPVSIDHPEES